MQKLDVTEGDILKDIQEVWVEAMSIMVAREKIEENKQQFEELVDNSNNLKQRERGNTEWQNMDQPKDMLEMEIEELWKLMMKQSMWRKMIVAGRMTNQNLNLIDKEKQMKQKTAEIQQQKRCNTFGQLQTKVWDPRGFYQHMKTHDQEIMNIFYFGSLMQEHSTQEKIIIFQQTQGVMCFKEVDFLSLKLM